MPTYDFHCKNCSCDFEERQSMTAPPVTPCPECGEEAGRQFSANVNFQFKGSGFYITDYRSDKYKKDAAKDKNAAVEKKDSTEKKAENSPKEKTAGTKSSATEKKTTSGGK